MAETPQSADAPPLNGWKEIATYLDRSVRSVQRYERELGLPVHRVQHPNGQTVYAFGHEIDRWRREMGRRGESIDVPSSTPAEDGPARRSGARRIAIRGAWAAVGLAMVVGAIAIARSSTQPGTAPVHFALDGTRLQAFDAFERLKWVHDFETAASLMGGPSGGGAFKDSATITDLDGDGELEALVPIRFGPVWRAPSRSDVLYAFARDGTIRWSITPEQVFRCADDTYSGPWQIQAMAVSSDSGPKTTWVAFSHHTWWPSFVLEIKPDGTTRVRYLQTGWILSLAIWRTPRGPFLAAGGVSNEYERPILSLVDVDSAPASTPSKEPRFICDGRPIGAPAAVFLFPNPETVTARGTAYGLIRQLQVVGEDLKLGIDATDGAVIVRIGPDLAVRDMSFSDDYWALHRSLEDKGKIDHPAAKCPWVAKQVIRHWDADTGWRDTIVVPSVRTSLTAGAK